jgi:hypothetical protein
MSMLDLEWQDYALLNHPGFVEGLPKRCRMAEERYFEVYENTLGAQESSA